MSVDLKNVVNELLSIGNNQGVNKESLLKEQTSNLEELGESYENLLENISIFAQTGRFEVLIDSSDFSIVSSVSSDSEDPVFETNDSGIDDSMPGVTKEGSSSSVQQLTEEIDEQSKPNGDKENHKSKDGAPRRHRKHRTKESSLHRSESEPRKSSTSNGKEDEDIRSESLPRPKKHRDKDGKGNDNTLLDESSVTHNTTSNGEPKKRRHRGEHESSEHRKRSGRSRDRKSEANDDTKDGKESGEHRKRSSRSRDRKSEANDDTEKES